MRNLCRALVRKPEVGRLTCNPLSNMGEFLEFIFNSTGGCGLDLSEYDALHYCVALSD
jgi:hypothetical protein